MVDLKSLLLNSDFSGLESALISYPDLANASISIDKNNPVTAHPLHRLCDAVFSKKITDDQAVQLATVLLKHGSKVDGYPSLAGKDSPLIAACSLHADKVALFLIQKGANINHPGTHGGTALHWAAWSGRPSVVKQLLESGAAINQTCHDFGATPLFWSVQGMVNDSSGNTLEYQECIQILKIKGANINLPNAKGKTVLQLLKEHKLDQLAAIMFSHSG